MMTVNVKFNTLCGASNFSSFSFNGVLTVGQEFLLTALL
jgi:hypothetical protein